MARTLGDLVKKGVQKRKRPLRKKGLSASKAQQMLDDNSAQGHALTPRQKKLFRAVAHGFRPAKLK